MLRSGRKEGKRLQLLASYDADVDKADGSDVTSGGVVGSEGGRQRLTWQMLEFRNNILDIEDVDWQLQVEM